MITLEHVAITSTKETFAPTLAFYQNLFGLKVIREGKDLVFLSDGRGGRVELLMYGEPALPGPSHVAFAVPLGEFDAMVKKLREGGATVKDPIATPSGDRLCYFNDPAGNAAQIVGRNTPMPQ